MNKDDFAALGIPWPLPDAELGMRPNVRFSRCLKLTRESGVEEVHYIPWAPQPPTREVPARVETFVDDDGYEEEMVTEWRTLSDEEFADAQKKYEKALAAHRADPGVAYVQGAIPPPRGEFVLEDGSLATALLDVQNRRWRVIEWKNG